MDVSIRLSEGVLDQLVWSPNLVLPMERDVVIERQNGHSTDDGLCRDRLGRKRVLRLGRWAILAAPRSYHKCFALARTSILGLPMDVNNGWVTKNQYPIGADGDALSNGGNVFVDSSFCANSNNCASWALYGSSAWIRAIALYQTSTAQQNYVGYPFVYTP